MKAKFQWLALVSGALLLALPVDTLAIAPVLALLAFTTAYLNP